MTTLGPYELNTIVCGECSAMMAALPANSIDFWLTSPPYDGQRIYNGYTFYFEAIAAQLYRVTKPGGVGVWVVADETKDGSESGTSFRQALGFMAAGFNLHDTMIFQADKPPLNNRRYNPNFEFMFILSKGATIKTFNPLLVNSSRAGRKVSYRRTAESSNQGSSIKKKSVTLTVKEKRVKSNVWHYTIGRTLPNSEKFVYQHPAIFPEALARDHILSWSNPGDIVLDPMVGSGTTAKQAHLLGRHYLGFDISAEYVELARRRLANVEAQPFLMPPSVEANGKPVQARLGLDAT